jgi:hypothetical protein
MLIVRDWLLVGIVFFAGAGIWFWMRRGRYQALHSSLLEDMETLVVQLRSKIAVSGSMIRSLESSLRVLPVTSVLRDTASEVVSQLQMREAPAEAVEPLYKLRFPPARRLANTIKWASEADHHIHMDMFTLLLDEVRHQKMLRSKINQTASMVKGTIRILQAVFVSGFVVVVMIPSWRNYFLGDTNHRMLLITLVILGLFASLYFEVELYSKTTGDAI